MPQSSYIAGFLIVGFLVFITARGELSSYLQVLGIVPGMNGQQAGATSTGATVTGNATPAQVSQAQTTLSTAQDVDLDNLSPTLPDISDVTI